MTGIEQGVQWQKEAQRLPVPFYQAILENQETYRQRKDGREMPKLSKKIEMETKRIFAPYIDPNFPRVLVSWNMIVDLQEERAPYHRYESGYRFPETISEDNKRSYIKGIYAMNGQPIMPLYISWRMKTHLFSQYNYERYMQKYLTLVG